MCIIANSQKSGIQWWPEVPSSWRKTKWYISASMWTYGKHKCMHSCTHEACHAQILYVRLVVEKGFLALHRKLLSDPLISWMQAFSCVCGVLNHKIYNLWFTALTVINFVHAYMPWHINVLYESWYKIKCFHLVQIINYLQEIHLLLRGITYIQVFCYLGCI